MLDGDIDVYLKYFLNFGISLLFYEGFKRIIKIRSVKKTKTINHDIKYDIFDLMKNTPLLYIKSISELIGCKVYAKCEYFLPYTSKDRMIKNILLQAKEY